MVLKEDSSLQDTVDRITEKQLMDMLIDNYYNLQRIKMASDRDREIDYQIATVKARLKVFDISID